MINFRFIALFVFAMFLVEARQAIAAAPSSASLHAKEQAEWLEAALENGDNSNGAVKIVEYKHIGQIRNAEIKAFVSEMKRQIEEAINLEVDSSAVSTVGKMQISATVVLSKSGQILGGSVNYHQVGRPHPDQSGDQIVSRHFANETAADQAGYTVRTGWSFTGQFDRHHRKFGYWDPDNRMSFMGY